MLPELETSPWRTVLADPAHTDEWALANALGTLSKQQREEGNDAAADALRLLEEVLRIHLQPDDPASPFGPWIVTGDTRSLTPDDLTDAQIEDLQAVMAGVDHPLLESRVGDLLWVRRRDHRAAHRAVGAYLRCAKTPRSELRRPINAWLQRADALAAELEGPQGRRLREVHEALEDLLGAALETDQTRGSLPLLDLLASRRLCDAAQWAPHAERLAEGASGDPAVSEKYAHVAAKLYRCAKDDEGAARVTRDAAERWAAAAELVDEPMMKAHYLRHAVQAYRRVPNAETRRQELHAHLLVTQESLPEAMGTFSVPLELRELPDAARGLVADEPPQTALFLLGLSRGIPTVEEIRNEAEGIAKDSPLHLLFSTEHIDDRGRTTYRKTGGVEDPAASIDYEMHKVAGLHRQVAVVSFIEPARREIAARNVIRLLDFEHLAAYSAFVPDDRVFVFARALHAGLYGDFLVASHLLVPQFEHSIRAAFESHGRIVSGLDERTGTQDVHSLNSLLVDRGSEADEIFGAHLSRELRSLLVDRAGENLRNVMMHGLVGGTFAAPSFQYLWWLALHLCCRTYQGPLPDGFHRREKAA